MEVLVDGEIVAFKAAFATEYKVYTHPTFGTFRRKKELTSVLLNNLDEDEIVPEDTVVETVLEPIENTFDVLEGILLEIRLKTGATKQTIHITRPGSFNFRKSIDYPVKYKGTRSEKPSNYLAIIAYLDRYKGSDYRVEWVDEIETDDRLGIRGFEAYKQNPTSPSVIIASIDKDLLQIPGLHYDINGKTIREISLFEADKQFYRQMLIGDRVDNVIGIDGVGPVGADKRLADSATPADMEAVVVEEYKKAFGPKWEKMFEANKVLLRILREPL